MFGYRHDEETSRCATIPEAIREWAWNVEAPSDKAWILSDYDVWVANPHYVGPPVRHPEDYDYEGGNTPPRPASWDMKPDPNAFNSVPNDDIPF